MKPNSSRPRVVCRIVRHWRALSDAGESRHVTTCPHCQEFYRASRQLEQSLRHAGAFTIDVSPDLADRILGQIGPAATTGHAASRPPRRKSPSATNPLFAAWAGGLAVAGLAVAVVWWSRPAVAPESTRVTRAEVTAMVNTVQVLSNQLVHTVLPTTGEFVANNPLQQEFDSIYEDARSAIGFLRMNFLPGAGEKMQPRSG